MATNLVDERGGGSFLLQLLYFAGWQLNLTDGAAPRIRATRADVELEATGASLAETAGIIFAKAMRSSRRRDRPQMG